MGYKAAIQVLKKADLLKAKVTRKCDLLNDLEAWTDQQQLQTIYHQVLVLDLEYALDKKVEQELWTLGFKNHISTLQEQARDKKNPRRAEAQALLSWCLEAASGFYLTLLQELCSTYDLDLPFRKSVISFGKLKSHNFNEPSNIPQSSSCLYICQYCLIHLGDIARYRNEKQQAESFYKHAILVSPFSGHPYNQLALLEASEGDKLSTVFYYVRGIALKSPFPAASTNLSRTLAASLDKDEPMFEMQPKMTVNEFIRVFLRAHSLLHTDYDLIQARICVESITAALTALIATQSFTTDSLVKMTVINLYALKHTVGDDVMKCEDLTEDERQVRALILDLLAGSLSAFLLPVYTLKADQSILSYYALPAIRLILMWIQKEPQVLTDPVFAKRLQIWPGCCKLLNTLQNHIKDDNYDKYDKVPLSYDKELRGFVPLSDSLDVYDYASEPLPDEFEIHLRAKRLLAFGQWITTYDVNGSKLMICSEEGKLLHFEPACIQPDPTIQLLEEMKSFKVEETKKVHEKRVGILKPQGSLEKSREERVQVKGLEEDVASAQRMDSNKLKRITQNVALQSIYKKIEENKQVKFSAETTDKDKSPKLKRHPQVSMQPLPPYMRGIVENTQNKDFFSYPQQQQQSLPPNPIFNNDMLKQKMQFPPPNMMNTMPPNFSSEKMPTFNMPPSYNKEERPNNWWPNQPNFPQNDFYRQQPPPPFPPPNHNHIDVFNLSPWSNNSYNASNSNNLSMRQAMLNETKNNNIVNNAPGYSLFNPTSWTPNLPGQLRTPNQQQPPPPNPQSHHHQSLFSGGSGPQSLQQLLEQQNQFQKGDT